MNSSHDLRSIRAWLNGMYPSETILIQRNAQTGSKPYFFLEGTSETYEDQGFGYHDTTRIIRIHLFNDNLAVNSNQQDGYWKLRAVLDFLRERSLLERVIPAFLWNFSYPAPLAWKKSTGGALAAGTYQFAVTGLSTDGKETLLSPVQTVALSAGERLFLTIPNWPVQKPLVSHYFIYSRVGQAPWYSILEVPIALTNAGYVTQVELTDLTPGLRQPPSSSKILIGQLKVHDATLTMMESMNEDDTFHGWVQLRLTSHAPHGRVPAPLISLVDPAIAVS